MKYNGAYGKDFADIFDSNFKGKLVFLCFIKTWKDVSNKQEVTFCICLFLIQRGEKTYALASVHLHILNGTQWHLQQ